MRGFDREPTSTERSTWHSGNSGWFEWHTEEEQKRACTLGSACTRPQSCWSSRRFHAPKNYQLNGFGCVAVDSAGPWLGQSPQHCQSWRRFQWYACLPPATLGCPFGLREYISPVQSITGVHTKSYLAFQRSNPEVGYLDSHRALHFQLFETSALQSCGFDVDRCPRLDWFFGTRLGWAHLSSACAPHSCWPFCCFGRDQVYAPAPPVVKVWSFTPPSAAFAQPSRLCPTCSWRTFQKFGSESRAPPHPQGRHGPDFPTNLAHLAPSHGAHWAQTGAWGSHPVLSSRLTHSINWIFHFQQKLTTSKSLQPCPSWGSYPLHNPKYWKAVPGSEAHQGLLLVPLSPADTFQWYCSSSCWYRQIS